MKRISTHLYTSLHQSASRADALTEMMNMGMGHANALNQLFDRHIALRVPGVDLLAASDAERRIVALGLRSPGSRAASL